MWLIDEVKIQNGILAVPERKSGRRLSITVTDAIHDFFENDEHTRLMPGRKDFVSIKRNAHKQRHLLLCNLKEAYTTFKERYPDIKIGFSKFCSLRPKWCITVGSIGKHSACICAIHQKVILIVQAAATDKTYKDLMNMIVCSCDIKEHMVHRCDKSPTLKMSTQIWVRKFASNSGKVQTGLT